MKEMQKKGKKGKNVSKHVKLICISNNIGAYISKHCAISLIWIALTMLFLKLFAFFSVTKFQFLVILSEDLSIGFERNCRPRAIILDNSWAKNANLWLMLNCNLFSITLSPDAALILLKNVTLYRITDHWWLDQKVKKLIAFALGSLLLVAQTLASLTTPASCGMPKKVVCESSWTWLLNSLVFLVPLFAYRWFSVSVWCVLFSFKTYYMINSNKKC